MRDNVAWAIRLVWSSSRSLTLLNAAATLAQSVTPVLGLYLVKLVVDAVAAMLGADAANGGPSSTHLTQLILLSAGVVVLDRFLATASELVRAAQAQLVTDRVFSIVHRKSIDVDLDYYERPDCQDTLHRAQQEAPFRPTRILNALFRGSQSVLSLGVIAALMWTIHWSVPLILVAAGLPSLLIRLRFSRKLYLETREQTPNERRAAYFNAILTGDMHAKELRLFGLGELFSLRFGRLRDAIRARKIALLKKRSLADLLAEAAGALPVFALYGFVAHRAVQGLLTVGDLVMFYQAIQRGQSYLQQLFGSVGEIYENQLFLSNMQEFLSLEPKIKEPTVAKLAPGSLRQGIVFNDVRFRYSEAGGDVLRNVNLEIRAGEHIALVGENGCGKTTLVKLLCRLYDPTEGSIAFDGIDIRELPLATLRQRIGVVFQDYNKYNLSVRDNIWLGNVQLPPDADIERAAKLAGIDGRVNRLPRRYDTLLGRKYESGQELSIGEWQKIALARAFFREADLVILDEPSSALDAKAELDVFEKFHALFKGRTAILISHRLSTVRMADRIYFLENGAVVEAGSHSELIHRRGRYAFMFEQQAQSYR